MFLPIVAQKPDARYRPMIPGGGFLQLKDEVSNGVVSQ